MIRKSSSVIAPEDKKNNISTVSASTGYQVPVIDEIIISCKHKNQKPFTKAIMEFKSIMASTVLSPLEKLYRLQYLSILDGYQACESGVTLNTSDNIFIMTYIIIQSGIPDLASQVELITAFASEYMQEGQDGCKISQVYLQLIACQQYLERVDLNIDEMHRVSTTLERLPKKGSKESKGSLNDSIQNEEDDIEYNPVEESMLGLSDIMDLA